MPPRRSRTLKQFESQTLPETIGDVVCRAMVHTTFEDICFVHFPREEVPDWLLQAQDIEPASVGVIYTLTRQTLHCQACSAYKKNARHRPFRRCRQLFGI